MKTFEYKSEAARAHMHPPTTFGSGMNLNGSNVSLHKSVQSGIDAIKYSGSGQGMPAGMSLPEEPYIDQSPPDVNANRTTSTLMQAQSQPQMIISYYH